MMRFAELDDRARLLVDVGVLDRLAVGDRAVFRADLLDDVVEAGGAVVALVELVLDVLLAGEEADHPLAGHLLDLRREGDLERVRERHQQEVAHLPDRQHEVLLAEFLGDPLERRAG